LKTQQADSPSLTRLSGRRYGTVLWLNLVCLDAPLVAVAWLWLFARAFAVPLQEGNAVALFLTAWLIYLGDRLADATSLPAGLARSQRQDFCLRHRETWITTVALVAGFDAYVIWRTTAIETFVVGVAVGLLAVIYLVVNHPLGLVWRSLPAKELAIGVLFAAGTVVALLPHLPATAPFTLAAISFAALCALNCISIAGWEYELDRAQRKVSLATRHPRVVAQTAKICMALALACFVAAAIWTVAASIFICIGVSAGLLAWLNASSQTKEGRFQNRPRSRSRGINRRSLGMDECTAFADLVLLTPIIPLLAMAL
jgi:hypothetical protein